MLHFSSKKELLVIVDDYLKNPQKIKQLFHLFLGKDKQQTQKASWVLLHCFDQNNVLLQDYIPTLVKETLCSKTPTIKRNLLRILQFAPLTIEQYPELIDFCFGILLDKSEPIAIQVFGMTVLFNMIQSEPDLCKELQIIIEDQIPYASAGYKSRGKKILQKINS